MFTLAIKHAPAVRGSLRLCISLVLPALGFSHTISPDDCSLFSKGNVKDSLRRATKFLQVNRKKLFTTALWPLSSESRAFPFGCSVCVANKSAELLLTEAAHASQRFTLPHPASPCCGSPCCGCKAADGRMPGKAEPMLRFIPSPPERMSGLAPIQLACRL